MLQSDSKETTTKPGVPGFARPLNYVPKEDDEGYVGDLLPNALSFKDIVSGRVSQPLITLRELAMLQFMNTVTEKVDWHIKVNDDEIASKWKDEVQTADFTEKMADWCIAELRHNASLDLYSASLGQPPHIFVYNGNVVKSDTAVSSGLKQELQDAVAEFEKSIPEKEKDWHPGSNGKVWDLVHPSLFPLVYGCSPVLPAGEKTTLVDCIERCGVGQVAEVPPQHDAEAGSSLHHLKTPFSLKFQWLPCEVDISGEAAKITSYINNLHPAKEKTLYGLVERSIDVSMPLWNATLAPLADNDFTHERRIVYDAVEYDPDPAFWSDSEGPQQGPDEDEDAYDERRDDWIKETRRFIYPDPKERFEPLEQPAAFDLKEKYRCHGLQIIVKLANIQLSPDKPEYEGGSWHVEGQLNEHIVATSLYYYSTDNITTSTLSFRQQCNHNDATMDIHYQQDDHEWLEEIFGCEQGGSVIQSLGSVETHEGRLLAFPNILQHRVGPFKLADPTKAGHRKIVALFLVDPNIKVASTAHVPCQRQDWWWEAVMSGENNVAKGGTGGRVPAVDQVPIELQDNILRDVDFPLSMEQAKALRLELMEERKAFVVNHGATFEQFHTFSLCEH